jgi:acyl-coenzyme A synthetase/AMP-(fatty) acid ligase
MGPLLKKVGTLGSTGQLLPGVRARLLKPDGTYGGPGEQGELVVHSPSNALRYTNNEQASVIFALMSLYCLTVIPLFQDERNLRRWVRGFV